MFKLNVPTIDLTTKQETTKLETVYNIDDFPYTKYRQANRIAKKGTSYYNISASFDIESTTIDGIQDSHQKYIVTPQGFMYHWQFCLIDTVCFGRTWEEFQTFIKRLEDGLQLSKKKKLVVYIHNLSYEFQFTKDFINIESLFAKDKRKVMKCSTESIEYRCSYFLSNMSLNKFCENSRLCEHYKMVDTYDYKKLRTPKTILTNEELAYCYNDVRGLCECIDTLLLDDDILTLPLTNTGYVRREFRQAMRTKENRKLFEKIKLNEFEYNMLRKAFRGGNTHASRFYSGKILNGVYSFDISSSYPTCMMLDDFPMGKFTRVTLDTQEKLDKYCNNYCVVMEVDFFNIKVKDKISIPYIDIAHCLKQSKIKNDNGRVLSADFVQITLTNIDLEIIRRTYDFDGLIVNNAMYARRGKLPIEFRKTLMEFYTKKTELKDVDGHEYEYMKSKNRVNSGYGMMVTAIDHSEIEYINNDWIEIKPNVAESLEQYYSNRNNFLAYQWGVFVTANARKRLQDMIDILNDYIVYIDTDSIKFLNKDNIKYFEKINEHLIMVAENNEIKAYATDKKGIKRYLGVWDFDGEYVRFKTLGAKKYCYEAIDKKTKKQYFASTVSGMSKKKGAKAVGKIENFEIGKTFSDVGRTVSWYNESTVQQITVNEDTFTTGSNIGILETTYTLGITNEYYEILQNYVDILNQ